MDSIEPFSETPLPDVQSQSKYREQLWDIVTETEKKIQDNRETSGSDDYYQEKIDEVTGLAPKFSDISDKYRIFNEKMVFLHYNLSFHYVFDLFQMSY